MSSPAGTQDASEYARFLESVPWYVNGTLAAETRAWVDQFLSEHPEARRELAFHGLVSREIASGVERIPASVGAERLMQLVGDRERLATLTTVSQTRRRTLLGIDLSAIEDILSARRVAWVMTVLVAVQVGFIGNLMLKKPPSSDGEYRSLTPVSGPALRVQFSDKATEREIRELLVANRAHIVNGPNQIGEYEIHSGSQSLKELMTALKSNPLVESASIEQQPLR